MKRDFFDIAFLKGVRTGVYLQFCSDLAELSEKAGRKEDAARLSGYIEEVKTAQGASRVNPHVAKQNDVVRQVKDCMAILREELKHATTADEAAANAVFSYAMKGMSRRGKHEYIMAVGTFLNGLARMTFDGDVAHRIERLHELLESYQSIQEDKTKEMVVIKSRRSGTSIRRDIHSFVVEVCAKVLAADADGKTSYAEDLRAILANYRAIFLGN